MDLRSFSSLFISDLTSSPASSELSLGLESVVPVDSDALAIEEQHVEAVNSQSGLLSVVVLHKTKATWLERLVVEAHVEVPDVAALAEQGHQLRFLSVEAEVSNVECG